MQGYVQQSAQERTSDAKGVVVERKGEGAGDLQVGSRW